MHAYQRNGPPGMMQGVNGSINGGASSLVSIQAANNIMLN